MPSKLQEWFPWTQSPLICNGPMINAATPKLAAEVSKAGGLGFLACIFDLGPQSTHLDKLSSELAECRALLPGPDHDAPLNVGVGFVTGHESAAARFVEAALPVLREHRPAAIWLFAPSDERGRTHRAIVEAVRTLDPAPRVFVQVGNVAAAREAVEDGADVVVAQGVDAGGHQFRKGTGVVSLVPELRDLLGHERVILAAGGIADDRGVAAALVLGADGIVMGTRFTVAQESAYPDFRKELVLKTADGGSTTLKSPFNDQVTNSSLWGPLYDGRAIMSTIHERHLGGATLQELQRSLNEDFASDEATKLISTWAGTAVGLVRDVKPAGEIVTQVREGARSRLKKVAQHL